MESMRSLNTSLPKSPRRRRSNPPPEELIQTFKAAALSVTNLYKTAAADQRRSRDAGYQDALDDILAFLDKENLGLDDGEGWRVRQWATERLTGTPLPQSASDTDDDRGETIKRARSSSLVDQRPASHDPDQPRHDSTADSPDQTSATPMPPPVANAVQNSTSQTPEIFSFRSIHPYPQDTEMQVSDVSSNTTPRSEPQSVGQVSSTGPAVRLEVVPRVSRTAHRGNKHSNKASGNTRSLGQGAGSKRGFRFGDYEFDFGGSGDGRDAPSGGVKRGRFI